MDQFIKKVVSEGKKNHILFVKHILRGTIRPSILLPQNHKVNIIFISKETEPASRWQAVAWFSIIPLVTYLHKPLQSVSDLLVTIA